MKFVDRGKRKKERKMKKKQKWKKNLEAYRRRGQSNADCRWKPKIEVI